ncbi:hypothetical protein FA13DRAFT_470564 [Coprinellus micaceus]|uniref:Uncharacterized protein n=1 Tax=Coprinellus micaceus TaxID=71717 RepID=A0A4Y7TZB9_COPMI|nr:hypothetical protein FA13DRAFT_470564 [Coprinellus micaceus]
MPAIWPQGPHLRHCLQSTSSCRHESLATRPATKGQLDTGFPTFMIGAGAPLTMNVGRLTKYGKPYPQNETRLGPPVTLPSKGMGTMESKRMTLYDKACLHLTRFYEWNLPRQGSCWLIRWPGFSYFPRPTYAQLLTISFHLDHSYHIYDMDLDIRQGKRRSIYRHLIHPSIDKLIAPGGSLLSRIRSSFNILASCHS